VRAGGRRARGPHVLSVLDFFSLAGRVGLVTGAARGLGRAAAVALAEAGADVALVDVLSAEETCAEIEALGRRCAVVERDLAALTPEGAQELVRGCVETLGDLHIVVNNAGIIRRHPAVEYPQGDWEGVLAVNLTSGFYLAQAAAAHFLARGGGGKIISTASVLSFQGGLVVPAYAASKAAVKGLTHALANEWAPHGINVNAIAPSYFTTDVTAAIREDPDRKRSLLERLPAGRFGEPEDIKGAIVFLASDAAAYLHGSIVAVDGGWLSR